MATVHRQSVTVSSVHVSFDTCHKHLAVVDNMATRRCLIPASTTTPWTVLAARGSVTVMHVRQNEPGLPFARSAQAPATSRLTVRAVARRVETLAASPIAAKNFRSRVEPFLRLYGDRMIFALDDEDFAAFRAKMSHCKSRRLNATGNITASHANGILQASRRLLTKAYQLGLVDRPYRLLMLSDLPTKLPPRKAKPLWFVNELIGQVATVHPVLAKTLLLQFWTTMRPEENARVLRGEGAEIEPGVIALAECKTAKSLKESRHVLLCEKAMRLRAELVECWRGRATSGSIRQACRAMQIRRFDQFGFSDRFRDLARASSFRFAPHFLRHSSAQALADAGVADDHIRTALGRRTNKVDRLYFRTFKSSLDAIAVLPELAPEPEYGSVNVQWRRRVRRLTGE